MKMQSQSHYIAADFTLKFCYTNYSYISFSMELNILFMHLWSVGVHDIIVKLVILRMSFWEIGIAPTEIGSYHMSGEGICIQWTQV